MESDTDIIRIARIQDRFREAGFQWIEHIYNDGLHQDCSIKMTTSYMPTYFTKHRVTGDLAWGRFPRIVAWQKASEWLDRALENPKLIPTPVPALRDFTH